MVVADGLTSIGQQGTCNYHDDTGSCSTIYTPTPPAMPPNPQPHVIVTPGDYFILIK